MNIISTLSRFFFLVIIASTSILLSMDKTAATYNGRAINQETIEDLMPALPAQDLDAVYSWLSTNRKLVNAITVNDFTDFARIIATAPQPGAAIQDWWKNRQKSLEEQGLHNLSCWNYIFKIPNTDYYVKAAGPLNRLNSAVRTTGTTVTQWLAQEDKTLFNPTFQTVSRAAIALRIQDGIKRRGLADTIAAVPTYMVRLETSEPVHDDNVVIIERAVPYKTKESGAPVTLEDIAHEATQVQVRSIAELIKHAKLWDISKNIVVLQDGRLCPIDQEQPNISRPTEFFHTHPQTWGNSVVCGYKGLYEIMKKHGRGQLVQEIVRNDRELHALKKIMIQPRNTVNRYQHLLEELEIA